MSNGVLTAKQSPEGGNHTQEMDFKIKLMNHE